MHRKTMYVCDPQKAKECKKSCCKYNKNATCNLCERTTHIEWAAQDEQGRPIPAEQIAKTRKVNKPSEKIEAVSKREYEQKEFEKKVRNIDRQFCEYIISAAVSLVVTMLLLIKAGVI